MRNAGLFWSILTLFLATTHSVESQGSFFNLDFEAANVQDIPYPSSGETVNISDGVPGWNISPSIGIGLMAHNGLPLGGPGVAILGPNWPSSQILQGTYTVELFASTAGPPSTGAIFQTGQIPSGSQSIRFYGAGLFGLTFAGQSINLVQVGSAPTYNIFGGDISSFAGQTGQLLFTGNGLLDNITFSASVIPEPSAAAIVTVGGVVLGWRWLRSKRRKNSSS